MAIEALNDKLNDSIPKIRAKAAESFQPMSEKPRYLFSNAQNIQIVEQTSGGNVITHNYASPQNLTETVTAIQNLLDQLAETKPLTSQIIQQ